MVYAGTQRFELYGVADAEQHFFVELDGTRVKRLLWIAVSPRRAFPIPTPDRNQMEPGPARS